MQVVDDARVETDMRVDDQRRGEDGVDDGLVEGSERRCISNVFSSNRGRRKREPSNNNDPRFRHSDNIDVELT